MLQLPQYSSSLVTSTQLAPHWVSAPQPAEEHWPAEQTWVPVHTLAQTPQFAELDLVSTHPLGHGVKPAAHAHAPDWQVCPTGHALLQVPQFCESVCRLAHPTPHDESGAEHPDAPPEPFSFVLDESPHDAQMIAIRTLGTETSIRFIALTSLWALTTPHIESITQT